MKMANGTGSIVHSAGVPIETVRIIVGHAGQEVTLLSPTRHLPTQKKAYRNKNKKKEPRQPLR